MNISTNFNQARSGKIYIMSVSGEEVCTTDLLHAQVVAMLPVITKLINFTDKSEFDIDSYQSAYGRSAALDLYDSLKAMGIAVNGKMVREEEFHRARLQEHKDKIMQMHHSNPNISKTLLDLGLSTRAFNVLWRHIAKTYESRHIPEAIHNFTIADALKTIPNVYHIDGCGEKSAAEIIKAFADAGVPVAEWKKDGE